jgi:hypothetical protein
MEDKSVKDYLVVKLKRNEWSNCLNKFERPSKDDSQV